MAAPADRGGGAGGGGTAAASEEGEEAHGITYGRATKDRARELAPARKAAEELFRQGNSPHEVITLVNERFGARIAHNTFYGWKRRMETAESADTRTPYSPDQPAGGEESQTEIPAPDTPAPADPGSDGEDLWELIMAARPPWSQKPRLARWMDLADAAYAFLVESDSG